jgi:hypothetical protein
MLAISAAFNGLRNSVRIVYLIRTDLDDHSNFPIYNDLIEHWATLRLPASAGMTLLEAGKASCMITILDKIKASIRLRDI